MHDPIDPHRTLTSKCDTTAEAVSRTGRNGIFVESDQLRVAVLCSRKEEDVQLLQAYLQKNFPGARIHYLLPDTVDRNAFGPTEHERIYVYPEGGAKTWSQKLRTVRGLRRGWYHYCICPFCNDDARRYYVLFFLLFFLDIVQVLVLEPTRGPKGYRKTGILGLYASTRLAAFSRKWMPRLRPIGSLMETWMDTRLDIPAWFLLVAVAMIRRFLWRNLGSRFRPRRKHPDSRGKVSLQVVHFIPSLEMGGAQRQLFNLLTKTRPQLLQAKLILYDPYEDPFEQDFKEQGVPFVRLRRLAEQKGLTPIQRFLWWHFPQTASTLKLSRCLKNQRENTIFHSWLFIANMVGSVAAALAGTPVVISSVRNMSYWKKAWYRKRWYRWGDRLTANLSDCIIVNAEAVKKDYRKWSGVSGKKIVTLRNGLDPAAIPQSDLTARMRMKKDLRWAPQAQVVGWVGRLAPEKDPSSFLDVAELLLARGDPLGFVVLGDGPLQKELLEQSARRGMDGSFRFLGARRDVFYWMQGMDVLVMTSIIEGMPNALIEAQFMGIPCVTTDAGGVSEVLEDGISGFVVPVRDIQALVERTRRLLNDPALRDRFSAAGRVRAQEFFHVDRMVTETAQLYQRLVSGLPSS